MTRVYKIYCGKLYWFAEVKNVKAKAFADLLTSTSLLTKYQDYDVLKISPRSDGKDLILRMDELAEPIHDYIIEFKAWNALCSLIETEDIDMKNLSKSQFISPVRYELTHKKESSFVPMQEHTMIYLTSIFKESLVQLKLVNVQLNKSLYRSLEAMMIKCIYLRNVELDNNSMDESFSESVIKVISEWALDKLKILKIKNNKMNINCCRSINYYLKLRISSADFDSKPQSKSYGSFQSLTLSNCGLEDWYISEFCDLLRKYNQNSFLRCDFSNNPISERGLTLLANMIASSRAVSHLDISEWTLLTNTGLEMMLETIEESTSLVELRYLRNPVRRRVYEKVITFIRRNKVIQRIEMPLEAENFKLNDVDRFAKYLGRIRFSLVH